MSKRLHQELDGLSNRAYNALTRYDGSTATVFNRALTKKKEVLEAFEKNNLCPYIRKPTGGLANHGLRNLGWITYCEIAAWLGKPKLVRP